MDAVSQSRGIGHSGDLTSLTGSIHGSHNAGLHADDLAGGLELLDGESHTGDQTAAADGDHDLLHFGELLQNLQTDGALTGNDIRIIEGMREGVAVLLGETLGLAGGVIVNAGDQNHFSTVVAGSLHLGDGSALGHADHGLDAQLRGGQSNALSMVAGGAGDDAVRSFLRSQGTDLVVGAADLESAGELQVLRLDVNVFAQPIGIFQRSLAGNALQRLLGFLNHL